MISGNSGAPAPDPAQSPFGLGGFGGIPGMGNLGMYLMPIFWSHFSISNMKLLLKIDMRICAKNWGVV